MMGRRIQMQQLTQIIVLVALGIFWGAPNEADAAEQRCNELGANCICSEPMNTNTWVNVSSGQWFNPADTMAGDKECSSSGAFPGAFIESGSGFVFSVANTGEAITNLPPGHTNTYVLRTLDGGGGQFAGGKFGAGAPTARRSIRFYQYYSSAYSFVNEVAGCLNSNKYAELGYNGAGTAGAIFTVLAGTWSFYAVETSTNWNQNGNGCCSGPGPGTAGAGPSTASMKGKWMRYEIIVHNALTTGPATTFEVYVKNVTDNGPEIKIIDTSVPTTMGDGVNWTTSLATTLHPNSTINEISIDMFRNGSCTGFAAYSYYLAAAWSSDAGQRIGAAVEIEGGGGTNPAPTAPVGLTIQ